VSATTIWETEGRELKVGRLVIAADKEFAPLDPYRFADAIAAELEGWPAKKWNALAAKHGIRNPSPTTRAQVIARYRARAVEYLAEISEQPEVLS